MQERWIVRVKGHEYGPVDLDTLREWQTEGRLIPTNPIRREGEESWITAGHLSDLFPRTSPPDLRIRRRSFSEIIAESLRVFAKGFPQFFCLGLLVAIPSFVLQVSLAFVNVSETAALGRASKIASVVAVFSVLGLFAAWPVFLGGLQFGAADLAEGRAINLRNLFQRAVAIWKSLARVSLVVYSSYLFWTVVPLFAMLSLLAGEPSLLAIFVVLLILAFQVYVAGRLFVNFMFWQQTSALDQLETVDALRESKELARSRPNEPRMQRPLYRGALIASLWLIVLLVFSAGSELPFLLVRLQGVTTLEEMLALIEKLKNATAPDAMTIATYAITSLIHAALRPLLGIAFVILYFDVKAGRGEEQAGSGGGEGS